MLNISQTDMPASIPVADVMEDTPRVSLQLDSRFPKKCRGKSRLHYISGKQIGPGNKITLIPEIKLRRISYAFSKINHMLAICSIDKGLSHAFPMEALPLSLGHFMHKNPATGLINRLPADFEALDYLARASVCIIADFYAFSSPTI